MNKECQVLNNAVIQSIQSYLSGMDWAQVEYKGEQLQVYLSAIRDAYFGEGFRFKLCKEATDSYYSRYYVLVQQFEDPFDCWSNIYDVCRIYAHSVVYSEG